MTDDGYTEVDRPGPEVQVVLHQVDVANPRPYRRKNAPTFVVAMGYLDAPPTDLLAHRLPAPRARSPNLAVLLERRPRSPDRVVRHARAGHVHRRPPGRRRRVLRRGVRAHRAAGVVPARDRQRVPHRPARGALGGRRPDRADRACRRAARRARPAAGRVPDRGDPLAARPAAREAALRHRRPELRQRQRAPPGRRPSRATGPSSG